jgi:thymidylate synthase
MEAYFDILRRILSKGEVKENRTGVDAITVAGAMFEHDMSCGFPILTTKKMPMRLIAAELEFFIRGITDKNWLRSRNVHIWDEWCRPDRVPYGHDDETKRRMSEERDLGPIYGWQWRNFGAEYVSFDQPPRGQGVDQLKRLVETLKNNPGDRRMIVSAWNPKDMHLMALPPCHYSFQVTVINGRLNLLWEQRSVDSGLGLPFNIASYALLLHLLAKETGLQEGRLVGFLADLHIYVNHMEKLKEQLTRKPGALPSVVTTNFTSLFDWHHEDSRLVGYQPHPKIDLAIAV